MEKVVETITAVSVCGCDKQPLATRFTPAAASAATEMEEEDEDAAGMEERCEGEEVEDEVEGETSKCDAMKLVSLDPTSMRVEKQDNKSGVGEGGELLAMDVIG